MDFAIIAREWEVAPVLADFIAPWIIESWTEAFGRLAVDLPLLGPDDPFFKSLILAVVSLVLLAYAWAALAALPLRAKVLARLLTALPLLVLPGLFATENFDRLAAMVGRHAPVSNTASEQPQPLASPPAILPAPAEQAMPVQTPLEPARVAAAEPARTVETESAAPPQAPVPPEPPQPSSAAPQAVAARELPHAEEPPRPAPSAPTEPPQSAAEATAQVAAPSIPPAVATPAEKAVSSLPKPSPAQETLAYLTSMLNPKRTARLPVRAREKTYVPVLYATDRQPDGPGFGSGRSGRLHFGSASIAVSKPRTDAADVANGGGSKLELGAIERFDEQQLAASATRQLVVSKRYPDHAVVFVHGFDTGFETALLRAAQFSYDLGFDGAMAVYSWPSTGTATGYRHDIASARDAAPHMAGFLRLLASNTSARSISIVAVGLGAQTALEALRRLKAADPSAIPPGRLREVVLVAPDMDRAALSSVAVELDEMVDRMTLYASSNDRGLNITRRHAGAVLRAGDLGADGPMIAPSLVTIDMSLTGTDRLSSAAPVYIEQGALVAHMKAMLSVPSAAEAEASGLKMIETSRGVYWVHPGGAAAPR